MLKAVKKHLLLELSPLKMDFRRVKLAFLLFQEIKIVFP
jgi:hypothetical protein